ncbi:MAG: DUF3800 domain-containing protein [Nitrospinae bacterium]|nr:DUF3800 domain-containing protein [Nitrospinota bacterium]
MSYLLFLDESGHDHRQLPYEVRGGVAIHVSKVWPFVQDMRQMELVCFGANLQNFGHEIKGSKLLDKDRFKWAKQGEQLLTHERQKHRISFLKKGGGQSRIEFTAYGQACLMMAENIFMLLRKHQATIFASAIPCGVMPGADVPPDYLRKDFVFLFERFYYFLELNQDTGLIVFDETEKAGDAKLMGKLEAYYRNTHTGRSRAEWVVPYPLFVPSDLSYPAQAADVCIYCVNWGFRQARGMDAEARQEIKDLAEKHLAGLQYKGDREGEGRKTYIYGIVYVPDPYEARR